MVNELENLFIHKDLIYTIYEESSFSKAAQKLYVAQPSLSLIVKKLEQQIGIPIFDRTTKPIKLTQAGQEYIAAVEQIRHIENSFENYIAAQASLEAGSLGIGSNQLLSSLVLPRYVTRFSQSYPKIKLTLQAASSTTLENAITSGQLDLIIGNHILPSDVFVQKQICEEHLLLAVSADFPENASLKEYQIPYHDILNRKPFYRIRKTVPLSHFGKIPFLLMSRDNETRKLTNDIFRELGFTPQILLELDRMVTLYAYVEEGLGASIVTDTLVRNIHGTDQNKICYYPLPTPWSQRSIYVSYKRKRHYSDAMEKFIDSLGTLE